jgi:hypothetical protein
MAAYVVRAERLAADPGGGPWIDETFFPWGTHYLLAALLHFLGGSDASAVAVGWGLLNAAVAPIGYFLAGRLHGGPTWSRDEHGPGGRPGEQRLTNVTARASGALLVVYYPLIAYGGYYLSESPFALFVTLTAFLGLRLVDHGRIGDALLFGVAAAAGIAVRTQLVAGVALLLPFVAWRRRDLPALLGAQHLAAVLVPLALVFGYSSWLAERHTGQRSPLPQNNAVNRAFGRCHAYEIDAIDASIGPPAFGALHRNELEHPDATIKLLPAMGGKLRVPGSMIDQRLLNDLADECVARTGTLRQAYYAVTHVVLLWGPPVAWPDMGLPAFRNHMRGWTFAHLIVFAPAALVGMVMGLRRRWPRHGVLGLLLWSMLAVSMLYMGEARTRVPYDALSIVLAVDVYARVARMAALRWQRGH